MEDDTIKEGRARDILSLEAEFGKRPLGVYLHFPFCSVRCTYCDFPTVAGRDDAIEAYLAALRTEIATFQPDLPREVDTIYLGGGTPSRMTPVQLVRVLDAVRARFDLAGDAEITLEGNPESLTLEHLEGYRGAGVTRVSVGVQSFDDGVLARVGRAHDANMAEQAVRHARAVGFPVVNLDLIAGLPGEDLGAWAKTVDRASRLDVDHLSVYLLETDKDTPLARAIRVGRATIAGDDAMQGVYEETVGVLDAAGLAQYEISNFARLGLLSRHNLKYWSDAPYAGFGLGAHGYVSGERRANRKDLDGYVRDVSTGHDPVSWKDPFDPERRLQEALFLGLRLVEGVDLGVVSARYGIDPKDRYRQAWERAGDAGIVEWNGDRVRLTPSGRVRSNELFVEFV